MRSGVARLLCVAPHSLYLLDYIDSPPLRQNVQHALNRGENYHQLRRAIAYLYLCGFGGRS